jgi:two-component system nitrogen regulation response regulator NtrX
MEVLQRYRWRGNIRELQNAVERLIIMAPAEVIRVEDLPEEMLSGAPLRQADGVDLTAAAGASPAASPAASPPDAGTLREFKDSAERAFLVQKLRENNWNISKTAEVIDTPRSNLYKKLEQYGIKQETDG